MSKESAAMTLMLKGLVADMTPEQKELFDKYDAELQTYIDKATNPELSDDERGALLIAITKFAIQLDSLEGIQ